MAFTTPQSAPSRWPYYGIYLALSAVALYHMRLGPPSQLTGKVLEPLMTSSAPFNYPGRPTTIMRRHYTGISGLDGFLSILVTAFLSGSAGFQKHIQIQQVNFLVAFAPVMLVFSIESVRTRKWSLVVFTSLWASLYQTVGGAVVIPLYFIAHSLTFNKPTGARLDPTNWAKTLLPSIILGYLLPTALMYYPFANIEHTMLATAFWQPSPVLVNITWFILSRFASSVGSPTPHLKAAIAIVGLIAAAGHVGTLYACISDRYPSVTLSSIFLPTVGSSPSFEAATHFIFQIDYAVIFAATSVWCAQTFAEDRARAGKKQGSALVDAVNVLLSTAVVGPGATLAWVWYGRQGKELGKRE